MSSSGQPIIIIKRRPKAHAGHHGGAWKVAYADFVTAMMSLFIVLWLVSTSDKVKKAVGGYFNDPRGSVVKDAGSGARGSGGQSVTVKKDDMKKLKEKLEQAVKDSAALRKIKEHIVFTVTNEGLRVELLEGDDSTFFESASPLPTDFGKDLLRKLADEIGKLPNKVTVEGHTDSRLFSGRANYSNWELSADRANAARRLMQENGIRVDQVTQVRGFADQSLRNPANPADGSNRRITLIIQYQSDTEPEAKHPAPADNQTRAPPAAPEPAAAPAPSARR